MPVIEFPARLPGHALERLSPYDRAAYKRGIRTMSIETELAVQAVQDRCRAIMELPELQVFGRLNNPLSLHFAFSTGMTVEQVRAETVAIRKALASSIPALAIDEKGNEDE